MSRLLIEILKTKDGKAKVDNALRYKLPTFILCGILIALVVFVIIAGIVSSLMSADIKGGNSPTAQVRGASFESFYSTQININKT